MAEFGSKVADADRQIEALEDQRAQATLGAAMGNGCVTVVTGWVRRSWGMVGWLVDWLIGCLGWLVCHWLISMGFKEVWWFEYYWWILLNILNMFFSWSWEPCSWSDEDPSSGWAPTSVMSTLESCNDPVIIYGLQGCCPQSATLEANTSVESFLL